MKFEGVSCCSFLDRQIVEKWVRNDSPVSSLPRGDVNLGHVKGVLRDGSTKFQLVICHRPPQCFFSCRPDRCVFILMPLDIRNLDAEVATDVDTRLGKSKYCFIRTSK